MDYATARVRYFIKLARKQNTFLARCEVCDNQKAHEIHHMRGRLNELETNIQYFLGVCRTCHYKITANPHWAYQMGYSISRTQEIPYDNPH